MIRLQLNDYVTGTARSRQTTGGTFVISGARLEELTDGLPHLRIEPRIYKGLTVVNVNNANEFAETSALSIKLKEINQIPQGLTFVKDTNVAKSHEYFLEINTGAGLEINQTSGQLKAKVDGTTITTNQAGQITLVSTADFLAVTGSFGTDGKLYLTFTGDPDTKSFRYKTSSSAQPTLQETASAPAVNVDANGNTVTLLGPYAPGSTVFVTALAYTEVNGGGIQTGPFKYQFTRGALTYAQCVIKMTEPPKADEIELEVIALGPGTGTVQLVEILGNTTKKSGPAIGADSPSGTKWVFNRGTEFGGIGQVRFRATIPNAETDDDIAVIPEKGRDTVALASRARVIATDASTVTVRYAAADPYAEGLPSVAFSYSAQAVGTIARVDGVSHTSSAAGTVTPATQLTTPEAGGSYIDYVIDRPDVGAGTGRVTFTATAANRTQDSDAVDVPEKLPDMAAVTANFDTSGQLYLSIVGSNGVKSLKYLVSTTSQPTFAQVDAATGANVQNGSSYLTVLPGPYAPQTVVYVTVVTYSGTNGTGKKSPAFTYQFVRGAVVYNQCRIEITQATAQTITVKVYADSLLPDAQVMLVDTTGTTTKQSGPEKNVLSPSGTQWVFNRGTAFSGGGQAQFRAQVTGAQNDDDYVSIPEQGRDTVYLTSRARVVESTDSKITVRLAVADPYPQGDDSVRVTYQADKVPLVTPASGGTLTPKAVMEETVTNGKATYIDYEITRPAAGSPPGRVVFTATSVNGNRIIDTDSVDIPTATASLASITGSFNVAGNLVFSINAPAGTGSLRYAIGTTAPAQTDVQSATIQAGNSVTVTSTGTYATGSTVHVAVITYPEANAGGTASPVFRAQFVRGVVVYNQCRIETLTPPSADQVKVRVYADSVLSGTGKVQLVDLTGTATKVSGANKLVEVDSPADWVFQRGAVGGADGTAQFRATLPGGQSDDDFVPIPAIGRDTVYLNMRLRQTDTQPDYVKVIVAVNDPYAALSAIITATPFGVGTLTPAAAQTVTTGIGDITEPEAANSFKEYTIYRPAFGAGPGRVVFTAVANGRIQDIDSIDVQPKEKTSFGPSLSVKETISADKYILTATFDGSLTYSIDGGADSAAVTTSPFPLDVFRNAPYGNPKNVSFKAVKDGQTVTNTVSVPAKDTTTNTGSYTFPNDVSVNGVVYAQDFVLTGGTGSGISGLYLDALEDVVISGATDGQVLKRVGGVWVNAAAPSGGGTITVSDEGTQISNAVTSLNFVGSGVTAQTSAAGAVTVSVTGNVASVFGRTGAITATKGDYTLSQLAKVSVSGETSGQVLRYNGTDWVNYSLAASDLPAHTHTIANITDLQTTLNGKAATVHTHAISDITNLQTTLDGKFSAAGGTLTGNLTVPGLRNTGWYTYDDGVRDANSALYYPTAAERGVRFIFVTAASVGTGGNYAGVMQFNPWSGTTLSTGDASYQLAFGSTAVNGGGTPQLRIRKGIDTTWNTWVDILTSANYGGFSTFTGRVTGATFGFVSGDYVLNGSDTNGRSANFLTSTGTALGVKVGSVTVSDGYTDTAAANNMYVKGNITAGGIIQAQDFVLTGGTGSGISGLYLDGIEDVVISNPTAGQLLQYVNGAWRNTTVSTGGGVVAVQDESTQITTQATTFNFTGNGVTAQANGSVVSVSIPGTSSLPWTSITGRPSSISSLLGTDSPDIGGIDTRISTGFYQNSAPSKAGGWPVDGSWHHLLSVTHSNTANYYAMQLSADFYSQTFYIRSTAGSGATGWSTIITSANIGSQSVNYAASAGTVPWGGVSGKPTTVSGYGITDAITTTTIGTQSVNYATTAGSAGSATTAGSTPLVSVSDTRSAATGPNAGQGVRFDFKANTTDGLADGGTWHGVMTFQQWSDASGGGTRQLGFTDNDNLWIRGSGSGLSSYGTWKLLLNSSNYGGYSTFSGRVTGATFGFASGDYISNASGVTANFLTTTGAALGVKVGSVTVSDSYTDSASSNNMYVKGNITAGGIIQAQDFVLTGGTGSGISGLYLDGIEDVVIADPQPNQLLQYVNGAWRNRTVSTGGGSVSVQDETTPITSAATTFNFTGNGVTAQANGSVVTVSIPGTSSLAWTSISGRPTKLSEFTNDSGFITASGSVAYATKAGSIDGFGNPTVSATANTIAYRDGAGDITARYFFGTYFYASSVNSENPTIGQIWTQSTDDSYMRKSSPAHFINQLGLITTSNIGSQTVSRASTAGSADSVLWGNVSGRPTKLSEFSNDSGYVTSSGSVASATNAGYANSAGKVTNALSAGTGISMSSYDGSAERSVSIDSSVLTTTGTQTITNKKLYSNEYDLAGVRVINFGPGNTPGVKGALWVVYS